MADKRILFVFGTRPEAIKLIPLIKEFERRGKFDVISCMTSQHKSMLKQVMDVFGVEGHFDLNIMKKDQTLSYITSKAIIELEGVYKKINPDLVFVQGDTTTAMSAALSAFYNKIPVAHVEAGLRTFDKYNPYPEEINRVLISHIGDFHFAPTERARSNLVSEGVTEENVWITGNTVIDALYLMLRHIKEKQSTYESFFEQRGINLDRRIILVTGHRRENFGDGFKNICVALKEIAESEDVSIIYPVHLNPNVKNVVHSLLGDVGNIHLIDPLSYDNLIFLMNRAFFVLTDSGGIQEEAPSLGKPVLVMRNVTERPEGVDAGTVKLVGTNVNRITENTTLLLHDESEYQKMSRATNPYGDGMASGRIYDVINNVF